ncbi:MAG: glycosyltransferase family 4 protein [Ardenticatenaceae bacterium]|nr:glycosyltransferase family 4 protein [Ardenticatenaceae bacterium]
MNVTIDASPAVHQRAGLGRYAAELIRALAASSPAEERLTLLYTEPAAARPDAALAALPARPVPLGYKPWRLLALAAHVTGLPQDGLAPGADLFHATDHLLPRMRRVRTVFTLHDLIFLKYPEHHKGYNRTFLTLMMPRFLRAADHIIAVSEHTRRDAVAAYGLPADKITVIYEAAGACYRPAATPAALGDFRRRYGLPERYILHASTIEPRKNQQRLLDAYAALRAEFPGVGLVMVGRRGWLYDDFFARLTALGLEEQVIFPGFVPEADLPRFYQAADCFVYPSLYEGFGLPPLEALACGTPVICSDAASLPEVVGTAGLLVAPADTAALTAAIRRVLADPPLRADLAARGPRQAARFSWQRTAEETRAVYRRVLGEESAGRVPRYRP